MSNSFLPLIVPLLLTVLGIVLIFVLPTQLRRARCRYKRDYFIIFFCIPAFLACVYILQNLEFFGGDAPVFVTLLRNLPFYFPRMFAALGSYLCLPLLVRIVMKKALPTGTSILCAVPFWSVVHIYNSVVTDTWWVNYHTAILITLAIYLTLRLGSRGL